MMRRSGASVFVARFELSEGSEQREPNGSLSMEDVTSKVYVDS